MNDYSVLIQIGLAIAAFVSLMVLLVRIIGGGQPLEFDDLRPSRRDPWPLGVQEEEPLPWKFATPAA